MQSMTTILINTKGNISTSSEELINISKEMGISLNQDKAKYKHIDIKEKITDDLNKYDFEKKKTIRNNINYARCMEKYFNENNMYSESNSILKEIIVEMISYYANYKEFDTIDISLRGR